jgi:hypothetical protein
MEIIARRVLLLGSWGPVMEALERTAELAEATSVAHMPRVARSCEQCHAVLLGLVIHCAHACEPDPIEVCLTCVTVSPPSALKGHAGCSGRI